MAEPRISALREDKRWCPSQGRVVQSLGARRGPRREGDGRLSPGKGCSQAQAGCSPRCLAAPMKASPCLPCLSPRLRGSFTSARNFSRVQARAPLSGLSCHVGTLERMRSLLLQYIPLHTHPHPYTPTYTHTHIHISTHTYPKSASRTQRSLLD